jgi:hypothetical protein
MRRIPDMIHLWYEKEIAAEGTKNYTKPELDNYPAEKYKRSHNKKSSLHSEMENATQNVLESTR